MRNFVIFVECHQMKRAKTAANAFIKRMLLVVEGNPRWYGEK